MHIEGQSCALDIAQDSYQPIAWGAIGYERDGAALIVKPVNLPETGERLMLKIRESRSALTQREVERRNGCKLVAEAQNFQRCISVEMRGRTVTAT
jgi:hypothetical protein